MEVDFVRLWGKLQGMIYCQWSRPENENLSFFNGLFYPNFGVSDFADHSHSSFSYLDFQWIHWIQWKVKSSIIIIVYKEVQFQSVTVKSSL